MKKLKQILLIDDDPATNFLHKLIIEKENCAENIISMESAEKALTFLTTKINNNYPNPELIFLDINMPGMNGWEFLKEYKKLDKLQHAKKIIIMLTTSLNPEDKKRALEDGLVNGFMSKPLTSKKLQSVLTKNENYLFC